MAREGMHYWRLRPDARLRRWIHCYWYVEPDPDGPCVRPSARVVKPELLLPDGHAELIFRIAGEFTRWRIGEPEKSAEMRRSYVIGGRSHSILARSPGGLRMAGVKLDPRALRALLGMPLDDFRDVTVACADLGRSAVMDLEDEVANLPSVDDLASVFDRFFLRKLNDTVVDEPMIQPLLERIRVTRGTQSILKWAREHAVDSRTLERRFVARMGMTPKQFARIERFKHSYARLGRLGGESAEDRKTHLEPYYDESHFNREFRHFLGTSPMKWLNQTAELKTTISDHLLAGEMNSAAEISG